MQTMREVVIVDAVRLPVGRAHHEKGIYRDVHPTALLSRAFAGLIDRSGIDAAAVDNVIAGCAYQTAEQSLGIARLAWLQQGLPMTTGATTVDIRCGSSQQAAHYAALSIGAGVDDVVIAAGVEHMGRVGFAVNEAVQNEFGHPYTPELHARYPMVAQGLGAEMIAERWGISRREMDEFALASHQRAATATDSGRFAAEVIPFGVGQDHQTDQGIRAGSTLDGLLALRPVFKDDGAVTAGNASQMSDGAAAILLTHRDKADELGLRPRARILDQVTLGVDPVTMLTGPIPATRKLLERNGLTIGDIDHIEINEAFASVVLAWAREFEPDMLRVNPLGGAIALGHPLGATGARLITTLVHALEQDDGELGVVTMCCGGGLGTATLIQRVAA